ncbi:MAG: hypothetical protein WAR02_04455, partial [Pseudolabrys sp.]
SGAPSSIVIVHLDDEATQLTFDFPRGMTAITSTAPIKEKATSVPLDHGFRLNQTHPLNRSWECTI